MSIPHRCQPILVAFVWESPEETINLPLSCLQGGIAFEILTCDLVGLVAVAVMAQRT